MELPEQLVKDLRTVQEILRSDDPKVGFNMDVALYRGEDMPGLDKTGHGCGTVACIAGHLYLLHRDEPDGGHEPLYNIESGIREIYKEADPRCFGRLNDLFMARYRPSGTSLDDITVDQAIAAIDRFIETNGEHAWDTCQ